MINIVKGPAPEKLESSNCRNRVELNVQNREFKGSYYNHKSVLRQLENIHHNKCSFCETKIRPVDTPQVEHYRPKNKLKNEDGHVGYYWLGHEWNNLLLACPACNKAKSSHFPIRGDRVVAPPLLPDGNLNRARCRPDVSPLSDERPLLLNPELDQQLDDHLQFYPDGSIEGLTERGRKSIKMCKLDRPSLELDRKKVLDDYINSLDEKFAAFALDIINEEGLAFFLQKTFEKIINEAIPQEKYTFFRRFAWNHFESFFVAQVEEARQDALRAAFQDFTE